MTLKHFQFSTIWVFPSFYFVFLNCADIAKDLIIPKIIQLEQIPKPLKDLNHYMSSTVFYNLDLNTQVTHFYCANNIYLKFFLCATSMRKWHIPYLLERAPMLERAPPSN